MIAADSVFGYGQVLWGVDTDLVGPLYPAALVFLTHTLVAPQGERAADARAGFPVWAVTVAKAVAMAVIAVEVLRGDPPVVTIAVALSCLAVSALRTVGLHAEVVDLLGRTRKEADTDGLTGLRNRRGLYADTETAFGDGAGASVLAFYDLDGLKVFNDTQRHRAGDELLARFARVLERETAGWGRSTASAGTSSAW